MTRNRKGAEEMHRELTDRATTAGLIMNKHNNTNWKWENRPQLQLT